MEEAVEKLTTCTSSGTNWPYALVQLCKDPHHSPLPKNKHLGILPQGKVQETFCGQISHKLLATGPQVVYPYRFEWAQWTHCNHSTRAAGQWYKPYCKWTYLLGDWYPFNPSGGIRPKDATSWGHSYHPDNQSPQSPPKSEGSITKEVSNLLSWAVLEASSCESQHSSLKEANHSSDLHVSTTEARRSAPASQHFIPGQHQWGGSLLKDISANMSPIAAVSGSGGISPPWT